MPPKKAPAKPVVLCDIPVWCRYSDAVDVDAVVPHPRNPNRHGDEQVALLAKNIRALGWRHPVIVSKRSGLVVAGHARIEAARLLGVAEIPVDVTARASTEMAYAVPLRSSLTTVIGGRCR